MNGDRVLDCPFHPDRGVDVVHTENDELLVQCCECSRELFKIWVSDTGELVVFNHVDHTIT